MRKSKVSYYEINTCEIYMHRLRILFDKQEEKHFGENKKLLSDEEWAIYYRQRRDMLWEILFMEAAIALYDSWVGGRGTVVYGWKEGDEENTAIRFGNVQVASKVVGAAVTSIHHVCSGDRWTVHGWRFRKVDYDKDVPNRISAMDAKWYEY